MLVNDKETAFKLLDSIEMVCGYCPRESDFDGTGGDCETCNVRKLFELTDVSFWSGYRDMETIYRNCGNANEAFDFICNHRVSNGFQYIRGAQKAWANIVTP